MENKMESNKEMRKTMIIQAHITVKQPSEKRMQRSIENAIKETERIRASLNSEAIYNINHIVEQTKEQAVEQKKILGRNKRFGGTKTWSLAQNNSMIKREQLLKKHQLELIKPKHFDY